MSGAGDLPGVVESGERSRDGRAAAGVVAVIVGRESLPAKALDDPAVQKRVAALGMSIRTRRS
jgi:hypothetical protein